MTKEELLRKRNSDLTIENEKLKLQLAEQEQTYKIYQTMVEKNNTIRDELMSALQEAYVLRDKYKNLIKELQGFKKTVKGRNAIERLVFDLKRK